MAIATSLTAYVNIPNKTDNLLIITDSLSVLAAIQNNSGTSLVLIYAKFKRADKLEHLNIETKIA